MKEKLTQAAITMWQKYGYNNVSINQICRNCGVTKGSFYHHFLNKESVLMEYFVQSLNDSPPQISEEMSCIEQIFELIRVSTVPVMKLNADMIMVLLTSPQIKTASNQAQNSFNNFEVYKRMIDCCRKGQQCGEIRNSFTAEELIDTALITMTGNMYRWVVYEKSFDLLEKEYQQLNIILK